MKHDTHRNAALGHLAVAAFLAASCGRVEQVADHDTASHDHAHEARFGGVVVALGDDEFHLEFVLAETPGVLQAYIFDAHLENFVRIDLPSFSATVRDSTTEHPLEFIAVTDSATGETVGDSALFEARADWLVSRPDVELIVPTISIKGRTYTAVHANLPAGAR